MMTTTDDRERRRKARQDRRNKRRERESEIKRAGLAPFRGANLFPLERVDFWAAPNIFLIKSIAVTRG